MKLPLVLIALLVLLLGQLYLSRYSEPYPAIRYPAFAQLPPPSTFPYEFERSQIWLHTSQNIIPIETDTLFDPVREKVRLQPILAQLKRLPDTLSAQSAHPAHANFVSYLARQIAQHPELPPVDHVEFVWSQYRAVSADSVVFIGFNQRKHILY